MAKYRLIRSQDIIKPEHDGSRPQSWFVTPEEELEKIIAFLNEQGSVGWKWVCKHSDIYPEDDYATLLLVRFNRREKYEYSIMSYDKLRPNTDGHKILTSYERAEAYIKNLEKLYNEEGWYPVDFRPRRITRDNRFLVYLERKVKT